MRPIRPAAALASMLASVGVTVLPAQTPGATTVFEVWGALSPESPSMGILGKADGLNLALVGVRVSRPLGGTGSPAWVQRTEWHFDLIPLAKMSPPWISLHGTGTPCPPGVFCVAPRDERGSAFPAGSARGIGITPVGLTTRLARESAVSPTLGATAGILWFDKRVPTTAGSRFNFTVALEAGLRIGRQRGRAIAVNYRFHHISSAGLSPENPGVASHLFSASLRFGRASACD